MFAGRFEQSQSNLEKALALYDPISHHTLVQNIGFHPHIQSHGYLGIALFCLGFPNQAFAHVSTAIVEARRLAHPPSLAAGLTLGAIVLSFGGDDGILDEWVEQLFALASEQGFHHLAAQGAIYRGGVLVRSGSTDEGLSLLREGSAAFSATGAKMLVPYHMALLARACEIDEQIDEAVGRLNDALQMVERTGERWLLAELYRHKGQLLLQQGRAETAEELYRKALSIAQEQEAKMWELRAATSLTRLWLEQGRRDEARDLLAPVYDSFTEGFDTVSVHARGGFSGGSAA
jgi:predicted ATPase